MGHDCQMDDSPEVVRATAQDASRGLDLKVSERAVAGLRELGVSDALLKDFPMVAPDIEGLLVYGSQARGDAVTSSDLDLLALAPAQRPTIQSGDVNVSFYTAEQLATGIGTLFGAHLKRDAKILWDDNGRLSEAIQSMGEVDSNRLFARARSMAELFTSLDRDLPNYLPGLLRQARYLLRSCLYAQAIQEGRPCFSVRELAGRHHDSSLIEILASRQAVDPTLDDLQECLSRLRAIIGEFPCSEHGSLEATIVNRWCEPSDVLSMAFMALGLTGDEPDYAEVDKILL